MREEHGGGGAAAVAPTQVKARPPWWCWPLLLSSVFAVSSAGVAFTYIGDVPALTLASWRLQLTALITLAAGAVQWRHNMPGDARMRLYADWWLSALSGVALALHFATWVWSLQHTSLAHSLLLVSTSPVLNVGVALMLRHTISKGEVAGSVLALAGCAVLAAGAVRGREASVTLLGDLAAFAAAVAVVVHWHIGQQLRSYQPVFVYAAPVTALAAALLTLAGLLLESRSLLGAPGQRHGAFGWLLSARYGPLVAYLGVVPGIVGHQGFNTVLKYMTPLLVSLAVQFEPVLGPLLGWITGVSPAPGLFTWVGGSIVLLATIGATLATAQRQQQEERHAEMEAVAAAAGSAGAGERQPLTTQLAPLGRQQPTTHSGKRGGAGPSYIALAAIEEADDGLPGGAAAYRTSDHHHHQPQQHAALAAAEDGRHS